MNQDLKKTLWAAADKLRSSMDAAEYKHIVLGLIFVKYISDAFDERRAQLLASFADEANDLHLPDVSDHAGALEERDYFTMSNVFWVPAQARWDAIRAQAKQADIGVRIDAALEAIEADNPRLKGILDKRFGRSQLEPGRLGELVDLISTIGFAEGHRAKDLLGEVYEYFLGQFASAEGKKGGQFYTPASVVKVLVEVLAPHKGRVYDPCCGSGGMFVQSEKFIESHGGRADDISIYGQEANPTTWRLVAMNLAIRGFAADLGKEPADTFHRDQHPDLRADYVLANPPFNVSDWGAASLRGDQRWKYGEPSASNANYAWLQHIIGRLSPRGRAAVVLANGSLSGNQAADLDIRRSLVDADLVEGVISLPTQLFHNTPIGACIWILSKAKTLDENPLKGKFVFVDARKLGFMSSKTVRELANRDINLIAQAFHPTADGSFSNRQGFSRVVSIDDVRAHKYALVPGRYVGFAEDDRPRFDMKLIAAELAAVDESIRDIESYATRALSLIRKVSHG